MKNKYVRWFKEVDKDDVDIVGGKGANLGEMTKAGFPVPGGFIITAKAYFDFLDEAKIKYKIRDILYNLDVSDSKRLQSVAGKVQRLIIRSSFPKQIAEEIFKAYFSLEKGLRYPLVAVRSSATAEDLPEASFAGQQSTFLNVKGEAVLIEKVREVWASLFTARAIFYRATNKFDHFKVGIAIPVQKMVKSDSSGIMFTLDPVTNDKSVIVIEAILGLGEMIVQGAVNPDHYEVEKKTLRIKSRQASYQEKIMIKKGAKNIIKKLSKKAGSKLKLTDDEVKKIAFLGRKLEKHYYFPQDVEWAIEKNNVYIVQTRPVTTVGSNSAVKDAGKHVFENKLLLTGNSASPGIAGGKPVILQSPKEIDKIHKSDVLVAKQTNPDFVPAMKKASAIVTERGGRTSHAAIVSRELGIPAVVGAHNALAILAKEKLVTVSGTSGEIFKGLVKVSSSVSENNLKDYKKSKKIKTATKLYVNLAIPEKAVKVAKMDVDGVGLLRAEFMIAEIGVHPKKFIHDKKENLFISKLAHRIGKICRAFHPRPVVYRATDFRTNEYRNLLGGAQYEPKEDNPMLGFRGAARYIANADVFSLELEAIKRVRNKMKLKNLNLMIPFVRSPGELLAVKKIIGASGLSRSANFKLWMMVELPTNVIILDKYLDAGIDGVSIGSNDLTMLILGTDRDNSEVAQNFNERDEAVLWALKKVVTTCAKRRITVSICGQAASDYPDLVEKLVKWGITSISVNADAVERTRESIYSAEKKI